MSSGRGLMLACAACGVIGGIVGAMLALSVRPAVAQQDRAPVELGPADALLLAAPRGAATDAPPLTLRNGLGRLSWGSEPGSRAFSIGLVHVDRILKGITEAHGATYTMDYRKTYPSIWNDKKLVEATLPSFRRLFGAENVVEAIPGMGGEDFSFFAQVVPGFYFRLGVANEEKGITAGGHTPMYDCDEASIKTGVLALAAAVCDRLAAGAAKVE